MHNMAKVPISPDHIFSTTVSGQPKSDILKDLQQQHPGTSYHFVEDKLSTLEKVPAPVLLATYTIFSRATSLLPASCIRLVRAAQ